jgi:iron complex outermembrane receptor protein
MLGNPQIRPEINNQVDLNLGYRTGNTDIDIVLFSSWLNSFISSEIDTGLVPTMPSSPGVRRFINIEHAYMAGFEINWKQKLPAELEHQLSISYTYGTDNTRDEPLPEIAPMDIHYTLSGNFINHKLHPAVIFRHVLMQNRISGFYGENPTPAFSLFNIVVEYKMNEILEISAGVQNLFDSAYYEHLSRTIIDQNRPVYSPGRNFFLSLFINYM